MNFIYDVPSLLVLNIYKASRMKAANPHTCDPTSLHGIPPLWAETHTGIQRSLPIDMRTQCVWNLVISRIWIRSIWASAALSRTESHSHRRHSNSLNKWVTRQRWKKEPWTQIAKALAGRYQTMNLAPGIHGVPETSRPGFPASSLFRHYSDARKNHRAYWRPGNPHCYHPRFTRPDKTKTRTTSEQS